MRLWHIDIIHRLPRQQLIGQHREACALRGNGWGKKHSTVDYVFKHPYSMLYNYHESVMIEMMERGYKVNEKWEDIRYRGEFVGYDNSDFTLNVKSDNYVEHDDNYMKECIDNLIGKGVYLSI